MRSNLIPAAYAPSKSTRAVKRVLRQRMFLVRVQTMMKNRIHALLSQAFARATTASDLFGKVGLAWLRTVEVPASDRQVLDSDLTLLAVIKERIKATNALLDELSAGDEAIRWLRSIPGIGDFFAVLIRYEVDDIDRFPSAKRFASYTGLVPGTYATGKRMLYGRLTKRGNKWLRWAFVEAEIAAVTHSPFFRRHYERIKARRGIKDARISTARKLAELTWTVWRERRCYAER